MNHLHLLYLVPDFFGPPGGIALYCRMVCKSLSDQGMALSVIALHDRSTAARDESIVGPTVRYHPCCDSRREFVRQAVAGVLRERPSLILVGHVHLGPLGAMLARLVGAQVALFTYGIEVWQPLSHMRSWALRRADKLFAISHFTARQVAQLHHLPLEQILVLHNCLDPAFIQPVSSVRPATNYSILTVARLSLAEQYKGHDYVIRALPFLLQRFPQLTYHIVGDGDGRPALEALARECGVAEVVRFHGLVSEESLYRHYATASLFIMPSRGEGFGFVFLEAMSQGLPAIGGTQDAAPESIVDGETGYLVDPTSVPAIVEAVSRLFADPDLSHRMGNAAMRHVAENFSFSSFQQQLISHLSELQPKVALQYSAEA